MIPETVRAQLRYVQVSDPKTVSLRRFPDFMIIGPQRTGTTWLHAQLRFHPQVMLSEPKELFYFSRLKTPQSPKFESAELSWYLKFFRDRPTWWLAKTAVCLRRFGELYRPTVRGEATASYAAIDEDVIREIVLLKPDVRAILMVRNPIDRAWSHAKKDLVRNRNRKFAEVGEDEFSAFFRDDYQLHCAHYVENIERWGRVLRDGHLFVGLFDDISTRPEELLLDVMRFLGVRSERRYVPADVRGAVNATAEAPVPPQFRSQLGILLADDLLRLRQRFGIGWPVPPGAAAPVSFVYRR